MRSWGVAAATTPGSDGGSRGGGTMVGGFFGDRQVGGMAAGWGAERVVTITEGLTRASVETG